MSPDAQAAAYCLTPYGRAMVEANLGLAIAIVTRTAIGRNLEADDRLQVAYLALIQAVAHFDDRRGIRFSSYACKTIVYTLGVSAQTNGLIGLTQHAIRSPGPEAARARRIGRLWPGLARAASDTLAEAGRNDRFAAVRTAVDSLPEPLGCVAWSRSQGMARDAIATAMGLRPAAVRTLEAAAYRRLRPLLNRLAYGE